MTITTLPTKTVGDLGPVKADTRAYLNTSTELAAAELEAIKQWIIDVVTEVGLSNGSTAGSLRAGNSGDVRQTFDNLLTEDDTPTVIFTETDPADRQYEISVSAKDVTSDAAGDMGVFTYRAYRTTDDVSGVVVDAVECHTDFGPGPETNSWTIAIQDGGGGFLEIEVTGEASKDIEWRAVVRSWAVE